MITQTLLGIIGAIALALSGFALSEIYDMNAHIKLLQEEVKHEQKVRRTLSMHWKLHRWAHDEINDLRHGAGKNNARWPSLSTTPESRG